jgi:hypothetical protein
MLGPRAGTSWLPRRGSPSEWQRSNLTMSSPATRRRPHGAPRSCTTTRVLGVADGFTTQRMVADYVALFERVLRSRQLNANGRHPTGVHGQRSASGAGRSSFMRPLDQVRSRPPGGQRRPSGSRLSHHEARAALANRRQAKGGRAVMNPGCSPSSVAHSFSGPPGLWSEAVISTADRPDERLRFDRGRFEPPNLASPAAPHAGDAKFLYARGRERCAS